MMQSIFNFFKSLIIKGNYGTPMGDRMVSAAYTCIGKDISKTENSYGCAESVNEVCFLAFGDYVGGDVSTYRMLKALIKSTKFIEVVSPLPGDIVIAATGTGNGTMKNGHVGILGYNNKVMSNNSATYLFDEHFTLTTFIEKYQHNGGFTVRYFRRILG